MKGVNIIISLFCISSTLCDEVDMDFIKDLANRVELLEKKNQELENRNVMLETEVAEQKVKLQEQAKRIDNLETQQHTSEEDAGHDRYVVQGKAVTNNQKRFILANEGPIAFTARIDPLFIDHLNTGNIVQFEHIILNVGGGYNENTGIFVTPISGIYMFSCSLIDHSARADGTDAVVRAEIVQSNNTLGRIFAFAVDHVHRDQGAQTVLTQVTKGEQVWVRIIHNDNTDLQLGGDMYSTFSGYLLWPME